MIFVQLLVTLRTHNDPTRSRKHCLHRNILCLLNIRSNPQPSPDLDYADIDMRNAMLAAGGPNYETMLLDAEGQIQRTSPASDVEEKPDEPT